MANRNYQRGWVIGERIIDLAGSFVPLTGAGTVVGSTVTGLGFGYAPIGNPGVMTAMGANVASKNFLTTTPGVLRTGTGLYTVTFEDTYTEQVAVTCDLGVPAHQALWVQPFEPIANTGSSTAAPVLTLQIVNTSGTAVDATSGSRVHFFIRFRDSSTQYGRP